MPFFIYFSDFAKYPKTGLQQAIAMCARFFFVELVNAVEKAKKIGITQRAKPRSEEP